MNSALMFKLTKLHLRSIKGNYVRSQKVFLPNGKEQEVTVFSGDNCLLLGQYTLMGTIVVHEAVLRNKSLSDYVVTHEAAHLNQWWKIIILPLALLVTIQAPRFLSMSLMSIYQIVVNQNLDEVLDFPFGLILATLLIAMPCAFSWILELDADFQSIKTIGLHAFLKLKNNELKPANTKFNLRSFIDIMTHPPTYITVDLWERYLAYKGKIS